MAKLQKGGAGSAPSIGELAAQVDTIITMLPSSPHVMDVYNKEVPVSHLSIYWSGLDDVYSSHTFSIEAAIPLGGGTWNEPIFFSLQLGLVFLGNYV